MLAAFTLGAALAGTPYKFDKATFHVEAFSAVGSAFFENRDIVTLDGSVREPLSHPMDYYFSACRSTTWMAAPSR
jgi:hypothetical protein